jgi:hypothetical protein
LTSFPAPPVPLLQDGSLWLEAEPGLGPFVARWLPDLPSAPPSERPAPSDARITVRSTSAAPSRPPAGRPTLRLGAVACFVSPDESAAFLTGHSGATSATVDLDARSANVLVHDATAPAAEDEVFSMATISSALLLGRLERALVHAAAIVAPDGRAWLLSGDTHAGKTTTTVNLIEAGWRYVSDDHVVLSAAADDSTGVTVEGWPRRFHLDHGWTEGAPAGHRGEVDPRERWPDRWQRTAPLAGMLFPRVRAHKPTAAERMAPAGALAALLRQTPWLMADRARTETILSLLRQAAALPAYDLRVGLDTYRSPETLVARLEPLTQPESA